MARLDHEHRPGSQSADHERVGDREDRRCVEQHDVRLLRQHIKQPSGARRGQQLGRITDARPRAEEIHPGGATRIGHWKLDVLETLVEGTAVQEHVGDAGRVVGAEHAVRLRLAQVEVDEHDARPRRRQ